METRPVVVLTREERDNRPLAERLSQWNIDSRSLACIETHLTPPDDDTAASLPAAEEISAVAFTSRRGAEGFGAWLSQTGWQDETRLPAALMNHKGVLVAAVGDGTAKALNELGIETNLIADPPRGDVLAQTLLPLLAPQSHVIYVRGNLSVGALEAILRDAGHVVHPLGVYENRAPQVPRLEAFPVSAVFVASPSAVTRVLEANPWLVTRPFVAVGPTTAKACKDAGVEQVTDAGSGLDNWLDALREAHTKAMQALEQSPDETTKPKG